MKKYICCFILVFSMIMVSCSSIEVLTYDQLCPAEVNFPYQIKNIGVVNNMPSRSVPKGNIIALGELEGYGKMVTEELAGCLADSRYFNQVIICDSALQSTGYTEPLSAEESADLASMLGVDMLVSFERFRMNIEKTEYYHPDWQISIPVLKVRLLPIVRLYVPGREQALITLSKSDTLYFDLSSRISEKELMQEASKHVASVMANKIVPYWETTNRIYFDGGGVEMRDAGVYVNEGNWNEARELWIQLYERYKKGNIKFRAAFNISLSYEMTGEIDKAIEWLSKASELVTAGSEEDKILKFYKTQLVERASVFNKLSIQMNRFKDDF